MKLVLLAALVFSLEANSMRPNFSKKLSEIKRSCAILKAIYWTTHKSVKQYFPKLNDEEINHFNSIMLQARLNPHEVAKTFFQKQLDIRDIDEKTIQESIPTHYADFIINSYKNKKDRIISVMRSQRLASMINSRRLKALSLPTFDIRMMAMYMVMQDCDPYKITDEDMERSIQYLRLTKALLKGLNEYVKDKTNSKELEWIDQQTMDEIWLLPTVDRLLNSDFRMGMPITDRVINLLKNSILRPSGPLILKIARKNLKRLSTHRSNTNYIELIKNIFPDSNNDDIEMFIALVSSIDLNPAEIAESLNKNGVTDISIVNENNINIAVNPKRYYDFTYFNLDIDKKETEVIRSVRECLLFKITCEIEKIIQNISHLEAKIISMYVMINNQYPQLETITDENLEEAQRFTLLLCSLYRNLAIYIQSITGSKNIRPEALMRAQDLIWLLPTVDHLFDCGYRFDTKLTDKIINALKKRALAQNSPVIRNLKQAIKLNCF